ncbi:pentapeptide repeat-containing protein [Amycolatopsis sp. Hca4]|uniref:pentapeptide repeat-containing protein n=1 Tax=Amycolatopsis sp. Hca4 TaxID=2742131 RepID=UPI00158FA058|nr:pentapeptide repeat-containing protein [Amycolatopsis sp. Hca4]QKV74577.1 pentapeptide repeat-containing protein [Amycolatopsis sp. Hca4]
MSQSQSPASDAASGEQPMRPELTMRGSTALPKQLPKWLLPAVAVGASVVALLVLVLLLWIVKDAKLSSENLLTARLEAVKITSGVVVSAGGALALYLAVRRQQATEVDLHLRDRAQAHVEQVALDNRLHQERLAVAAENDALQRRVTDLYAKSVEQLGSRHAPVRLGAMYALERLGQENPDSRQTVVNVVSAYLRMPFRVPRSKFGLESVDATHSNLAEDDALESDSEFRQELEVRNAAQRILQTRFRVKDWRGEGDPNPLHWGTDLRIDLSGATLIDFTFAHCDAQDATFRECLFIGDARFWSSAFRGRTAFDGSIFTGEADFSRANFRDSKHVSASSFSGSTFLGVARFNGTHHGFFECIGSIFWKEASFGQLDVQSHAYFGRSVFHEHVSLDLAKNRHRTWFDGTRFLGTASMKQAVFFTGVAWDDVELAATPDLSNSVTAVERSYGISKTGSTKYDDQWPAGWRAGPWPKYRTAPGENAVWALLIRSSEES